MKTKQKNIWGLIFLVILLIAINYSWLDKILVENFFIEQNTIKVERVIDGDTIEVENKTTIRMLGINTPEKGEQYYSEAKTYLENRILNQSVSLEMVQEDKDLYGRSLRYVFIKGKNVHVELVENGLATIYYPGTKDKYYLELKSAWEKCLDSNKKLCEKSLDKCSACISLENFDYSNEKIVLKNNCLFECDLKSWTIKDEGRKIFTFPTFNLKPEKEVSIIVTKSEKSNTKDILYWIRNDYVWTNSGDTLFLRDKENRLILWENY